MSFKIYSLFEPSHLFTNLKKFVVFFIFLLTFTSLNLSGLLLTLLICSMCLEDIKELSFPPPTPFPVYGAHFLYLN